jgi:hypothetical protein
MVIDGMTVRDLKRKQWAGLTTDQSLDEALDELAAAGWLRVEQKLTPGRPSAVIPLHPDLGVQS